MIEGVELTQILDPYLFDNHRDVTNALFEVYYDLSNQYIETRGDAEHKSIGQKAVEKVKTKYGLQD